ncbi:MAG: nucleoside transporter C-terminal domain-containing protein [Candidatus Omnitrophota bacterium]
MSKLLFPETHKPKTLGEHIRGDYLPSANWIEAIIKGANEGVQLCVGICALLLAFLGLLAILNGLLYAVGNVIHKSMHVNISFSLQSVLSYAFQPLVFFCGVAPKDIPLGANLLGERMVVTEVVAYKHLAEYIRDGVIYDSRSVLITTYILCGFAHIASLAVFLGGVTGPCAQEGKGTCSFGIQGVVCSNARLSYDRRGSRTIFCIWTIQYFNWKVTSKKT